MDRLSLLAALERDGVAFADSCAAAGLDRPVLACPGWNVAELVWHLGEVHHFWRSIVSGLMQSPDGYADPQRPADDQLIDWYRSGFVDTLQVLTDVDPVTPVWTWADDHTAGFVVRRMAQETAVHRWDADQAAKRDMPIEATLASDGIDEFLEHFLNGGGGGAKPVPGSVHLHCGDVPGEWTVRTDGDGQVDVAREHAKGDCAIRGGASDILMTLWRREPMSVVEVIGDRDLAERFVAQSKLE
jgi:uncharacterized protein (TIGR03083 family)